MLRGLSFVTLWAEKTGNRLPVATVAETVSALLGRLDAQGALASRSGWPEDDGDYADDGTRSDAGVFPLLREVSVPGEPSPYLTGEFRDALARLERLDQAGLLS